MTETYTASIDQLVARDKLAIERIVNLSESQDLNKTFKPSTASAPKLNIYNSSSY